MATKQAKTKTLIIADYHHSTQQSTSRDTKVKNKANSLIGLIYSN